MSSEKPVTVTLSPDAAHAAHVALQYLSQYQRNLRPVDWSQERMVNARLEAERAISAALRAPAPADLCSVCSDPAQPGLALSLLPVCTNCVRTGKATNKEEA